jgi:beta-phosphoglucomutase-like phosphatase (HAD superfamily)
MKMMNKEFTSMAQKRRFERQQKELKEIKMNKQLAKTESEQALERLEIVEGIIEQLEDLAQQPLSWIEMSEVEKAHGHLKNIAQKLSFDYHLDAMKIDPDCQ